MAAELIEERQGPVSVLRLNRPDRRNALTVSLLHALQAHLDAGLADSDTGAIVLTGSPPAFCAGMDLNIVARAAENPSPVGELLKALLGVYRTIAEAEKPIIAAVDGPAVAGGAGLVTVCDVAVAARSARLGYPEVKHGLVASIIMPPLIHCVGQRWAQYLLLTGELISAEKAQAIGLAHECTEDTDCLPRAIALAEQMAEYPEGAFAETKRQLRKCYEADPAAALASTPDEHTNLHVCADSASVVRRFLGD